MQQNGHYSNHLAGTRQPCRIVVSGAQLYIYIDSDLLIWNLRNSFFERKGSTLVITKGDEKLECEGQAAEQAERAYIALNGTENSERFKWKPVHSFFFLLGLMIVASVLLVYFYAVPWVAEKTAAFIPVDLEIKLGEKISESLTAGSVTNDSVNFYTDLFVKELDLQTSYPVEVRVLLSDEINAFALPGGKVFIHSGLLEKMDSHEQLVALIGHELTHVTMQHSLKSILRGAASGIVIGGLFGDVSGLGTWLISKADEFKQLHYSRELETEADDIGVQVMIRNQVDPKGMLALLKILKEEGAEAPELMKYLSTHPETDARIQHVSANPEISRTFPSNARLARIFAQIQSGLQRVK